MNAIMEILRMQMEVPVSVGAIGWFTLAMLAGRAIRETVDKLRAWRKAVVLCAAAVGERMKGGS